MDSQGTEGDGGRWLVVCTGPCCSSKGESWNLLERLNRVLKPSVVDQLGLKRRYCLGYCTGKPVLCVMPDRAHYCPQDETELQRVLQEHLFGGQCVEALQLADPHSRR